MKILLLEDDYSLNETIKEFVQSYGHEIDCFYDGIEAYNNVSSKYDLYILDINTPNLEGTDLLKYIKTINPSNKVIMISALIDVEKIKQSYSLGCEDYIKKPFFIEELILKIEKLDTQNKDIIKLGENIKFSLGLKILYINNQPCQLTKNEKSLIYLLASNAGKIISHEQIEYFVYDGVTKSSNAIQSMMKRLRKKLPENIIFNNLKEGYFVKTNILTS